MPTTDIVVNSMAGGLAGTITEIMFYTLDSFKIQKQSGNKVSLHRLFRGALPIALVGSCPSLAVFFGVFTSLKEQVNQEQEFYGLGVLGASVIAAVPSSVVAIPSDVLKKRLVLGVDSTINSASRNVFSQSGVRGFFLGWQTNLMKDIPFAALKMSLYEGIAHQYLKFKGKSESTALESAVIGFAAGTITAVLTCPVDCVNTRVKSGELAEFTVYAAHKEIVRRDGVRALFRGLLPRTLILSFGSSVFWFWYMKLQIGLTTYIR